MPQRPNDEFSKGYGMDPTTGRPNLIPSKEKPEVHESHQRHRENMKRCVKPWKSACHMLLIWWVPMCCRATKLLQGKSKSTVDGHIFC